MKMTVEVREMPALQVAYVRHIGPYNKIITAVEKVMKLADSQRLLNFPETKLLGVYHDDPSIVEESQLRSSACITVAEDAHITGDLRTMNIPGGLFAVGHFNIDPDQYAQAWDRLIDEWLPNSTYRSDNHRLCYEIYVNNPEKHPQGKHIVDICEPVCAA